MSFVAEVNTETEEIIKLNIPRGVPVGNIMFGVNATDADYAAYDYYPIVGEMPSCNPVLESCVGPTYQWNSITQKVDRLWAVSAKSLELVQQESIARMVQEMQQELDGGYLCTGVIPNIRLDVNSDRYINNISNNLNLMTELSETQGFQIDYYNVEHTLTFAQYRTMALEVGQYFRTVLRKKQTKRTAINAATTPTQAAAITWTSVEE